MRLPALLLLLAALALAACRQGDGVANANFAVPPAAQAGENAISRPAPGQPCINLNTATAEELIQLPGIGEVMSQRIIAHRERHGPFRRPQDIIIIEGFSERKYRKIEDRVCVD